MLASYPKMRESRYTDATASNNRQDMPAGEALQTKTALAHIDVRQIVHARINADDTMHWRVKADDTMNIAMANERSE